jgi:hypothetical protein
MPRRETSESISVGVNFAWPLNSQSIPDVTMGIELRNRGKWTRQVDGCPGTFVNAVRSLSAVASEPDTASQSTGER